MKLAVIGKKYFFISMLNKKQDEKGKEFKKEIEDLTAKWKRALADYQNLEKRTAAERADSAKYAAENIIVRLLHVLDILETAEKHVKDQGFTLAVKSFKDVLKDEGVQKIDVLNQKFNPHAMECVEVVEGKADEEVVEEVRPGYKLGDKIIRVAQVKVGKKTTDKNTEQQINQEL